jgi:protein-L-isoaspartate(D-aspartate) O-methyltransferase
MAILEEQELFIQLVEQHLERPLAQQVRHAFLQVPRHLFVHQYYRQRGHSLIWDLIEATPDLIYQDEALVTQINEHGLPSSSTSQPSVMAVQLEALALAPGQRVLEIGVGTGYNAALLGKLVGDNGHIISIDIDEKLVAQAKQHLEQANAQNVLALPGDGFSGNTHYASYDRILTTCSIRSVPLAWFEQLTMGGKLVGNWMTHIASLFVCVEKTHDDQLDGSFLDLHASYMAMRSREHGPSKHKVDWARYDTQTPTLIPLADFKTLLQNPAYSLLLQCLLPETRKRYRSQDGQLSLYLLVRETATLVEDDQLVVFGDEVIGQNIQQSCDLYHRLGQPPITAYHVTFRPQQIEIHIGDDSFQLPVRKMIC